VLFLDELPHFKPSVLDSLREPLETGRITIVRANWQAEFPARFQLLTAMNPCPAGMICNDQDCRCRPDQVQRYQSRVSGPLLDRIDLHVPVPEVPVDALLDPDPALLAQPFDRADIAAARSLQTQRQGVLNCQLRGERLQQICALGNKERELLRRAAGAYKLSARGFHRVMKVARTIADLDHSDRVHSHHLSEAFSYRSMSWRAEMPGQPSAAEKVMR
jgi:magnesium chelatase family protein